MKKRWRSNSRYIAGPASPSRSGEPSSPCRSGEPPSPDRSGETAPSDRSGERSSSALADPDREGGDQRMHHRRSESGDGSPSPGEETAVRPKRLRNKKKKPSSPEVLVNYSYKGREGTVRLSMMSRMKAAIGAEERKLKEKRNMEKRQRKKEKQRLSVQHDALVVEESPTASEHQQQSMTSSLSPNSSPTTGCFADLQGAGEATEASSAPPSGKVESKQERKISSSDSTEKSNVGGVPGIVQEAVRTHASPPREEESIKQNDDAILKKNCLNDAELLMDQSTQDASHSSSRSGDAQNEDKDVHSDKKLPFVVEDEQDSDRIGVRAIEYHKQEQGREVRHVQDLFDLDGHTIKDMIYRCLRQKHVPPKDPFDWSEYEPQQLTELYQRLALYRIRGYDYEFSVDRKLAELDDATLAHHYPPTILYDEGYFEHYEESLEWYFDPERCKYAGFEDYQRLVLRKIGYRNWDRYNSFLHTYEKDQAYVQYCEAIEDETKWIDDYLLGCSIPWERIEDVAHLQSLKIAQRFPNVSPISVSTAFREHIWSVLFDFENYKGLDDVYFEIWKRVAKRKMDFTDALSEVYREKKEKMFPFHRVNIESELKNPQGPWSMKDNYDAYVACIDDLIPDDKALPLVKEAVKKMSPKSKNYVDYARKKMQIAKEIRLITKGRSTEDARQCQGDNDEAKLKMDKKE